MLQDFRYALRSLSKSPGFVLVATLCLGLALALNTTTFAMLDAMRHPSLPVKDPGRLFEVRMWGRGAGADAPMWERYSVLREGQFYEGIAFYDWDFRATVQAGTEVSEQFVARVSSNFFQLLGVKPEQGRLPSSGTPENTAVVSHDFWEVALAGRPLGGLTLWVNEREFQVIGVLPSTMQYPGGGEIWMPLPAAAERAGAGLWSMPWPVVKLKRDWTEESVKARLAALASRLTLAYGSGPVPYAFTLKTIVPDPMQLRQIHFAMAGAAFAVLLIACANLAGLMLVRGVVKRRELALRMALGAGRGTVARQLLAESVIVASAGTALGLMVTLWAIPVLANQMPPAVRMLGVVPPHPSWRVFLAGLGAAAGTLVLFGLWPAARASDVDVSEPLKDASAGATGRRHWRYSPLVVAQVALSLVLLMSAVLLTRAAGRVAGSMLGYDKEGLLDAWVWLGRTVPPAGDSLAQILDDVGARLKAIPGVQAVAARADRGFGSASVVSEFYDGYNGLLTKTQVSRVTDGFLGTLGIPVLRGRDFLPGDERAEAVIVDETVAAALWPDGRAVGQLIKLGGPQSNGPWRPVIGVARRALAGGPAYDPYLPPTGAIYLAWRPARVGNWGLAIRTSRLDAGALIDLRRTIRTALPPQGRVFWVAPWLEYFDVELRARFFLVKVFGAFSMFALLLAAIGLYGVVSYSVSQRMREFAVRIAVGAPAGDMMRLVVHDAAVMILAGTAIGAFLAMWGSTMLGDWLYNVYHTDAFSLVTAELVLFAAGFAACLQPALRAMRADPIAILRAI